MVDPEELCQWLTPPGVAEGFLDWARIGDRDIVLEPTAGEGALVPNRPGVICCEIDPERIEELRYWRPDATVICADFLAVPPPAQYAADVCMQNPPYAADGEGVYLLQGLRWAPRCCGLIRAGALQGRRRYDKCWSQLQLTRLACLIHRPNFQGPFGSKTLFTPQYDYIAVEVVARDTPLKYGEPAVADNVEVSWVAWR
jgi:hypothetical protein